jgi:hypothetical protein
MSPESSFELFGIMLYLKQKSLDGFYKITMR